MDLKQNFILKCLTEFNETAIAAARAEMKRLKVEASGEGYESFAYKVFQSGNNGAYSHLSFNEYLRMVDMGAGRAHPVGNLKAVSVALQASNKKGLALVKDNIRKPKKFYSKKVYAQLPHLTGKLLYGFTDEAMKELKKELQTPNIS